MHDVYVVAQLWAETCRLEHCIIYRLGEYQREPAMSQVCVSVRYGRRHVRLGNAATGTHVGVLREHCHIQVVQSV